MQLWRWSVAESESYLKVFRLSVAGQQYNMLKGDILGLTGGGGRGGLLCSYIEPDQPLAISQNQFIIKKVPLAQKDAILAARFRSSLTHPNVPSLLIDSSSRFYITIQVERRTPFRMVDLLKCSHSGRKELIRAVLSAAGFLAKHYGFFYISQNMLSYGREDAVCLWIHEDLFEHSRKYPIDHGKISQELFVSDFRQTFEPFLQEFTYRLNSNSICGLMELLETSSENKRIGIAVSGLHKITMGKSVLEQIRGNKDSSIVKWRQSVVMRHPSGATLNFSKYPLKQSGSLHTLGRNITASCLFHQPQEKRLNRKLSAPMDSRVSYESISQMCLSSQLQASRINLAHSISSSSFIVASQTMSQKPKVSFIYNSPSYGDFRKQRLEDQRQRSPIMGILREAQESPHDRLKTSFPHTTTNTFVPLASNGNLTLVFNEGHQQREREVEKAGSVVDQHISEESNDVEMELDCLFSHAPEDEMDNIDTLMEEFENVLKG